MAMETVLITDANHGIGLVSAALYAGRGGRVIVTCRAPPAADDLARVAREISVEPMDFVDHASVDALSGPLAGEAIDIVINNAGIHGGR